MIKKVILIFAIVFSTNTLFAENNSTKATETNATKTTASKDDSISAAYNLLKEMNLKKVYDNAVEASTKRLVVANSNFKSVEGKIRDFYKKYIGWDSVKNDLAKLYSKYYTKQELEDITNFYKSKTGQKVLATMGQLSYEGQMMTQKRLKPHLQELKAILDNAMKKAEAPTKKDTKDSSKKESKK